MRGAAFCNLIGFSTVMSKVLLEYIGNQSVFKINTG